MDLCIWFKVVGFLGVVLLFCKCLLCVFFLEFVVFCGVVGFVVFLDFLCGGCDLLVVFGFFYGLVWLEVFYYFGVLLFLYFIWVMGFLFFLVNLFIFLYFMMCFMEYFFFVDIVMVICVDEDGDMFFYIVVV